MPEAKFTRNLPVVYQRSSAEKDFTENSSCLHTDFTNSRDHSPMEQTTPPPDHGQKNRALPPPLPKAPHRGLFLKLCIAILALPMVIAVILFWIYGTDTHHANRNSIWWEERGRNLIPPTATDITLRQDFLDHYAIYTVSEKDLNAFLDKRFASPGEPLDSFSERLPARTNTIGNVIGPLGWIVTENTVSYRYCASNGGAHEYYHDTKTGLTYQKSAYW